jgi:hypothetical protein
LPNCRIAELKDPGLMPSWLLILVTGLKADAPNEGRKPRNNRRIPPKSRSLGRSGLVMTDADILMIATASVVPTS